jgi:iron complex outermembrane receptor protein
VYQAFCAAHSPTGNAANANGYALGQYPLGRTSIGNPNLDPEKSTSYTLGTILEPIRGISFTVDYFKIRVNNVIANISSNDQNAALNAYFQTGNASAVPGVTVLPGIPDAQFPTARALPGFIQYSFQNADQERVSGIDFGMTATHRFGAIKWSSYAELSYLIDYSVKRKDGSIEKYAGTLGPCDYTSCSGSPKWRGNWQNTFDIGRASITPTVYFTSGYSTAQPDYGIPCSAYQCHVGPQWNVDLSASYKITDFLTIYGNVLDVLDIKPKFDNVADYSILNYNAIWGQANAVGRFFRIGAKLDLVPPRYVAPLPPIAPPPPPPAAPATITCPDGLVILANQACPAPPPPPPPPAPTPERGL